MINIHRINDFLTLSFPQQQEILRAIKTKERLDVYLNSLNMRKPEPPGWVQCKCIDGRCMRCKEHPGWIWHEEEVRDNSDIHPSQIGKCLKYLTMCCTGFAEQHEEKVEPRLRMIFDIGHAWHRTIQGYGRKGAFCDPQYYKDEVEIDPDAEAFDGTPILPIAKEFWIRGSADAVIDHYVVSTPSLGEVSLRIVHEYKTINSNQYERLNRPKPEHKKQATIYSAVFDIPLVVYVYTNKDNCQTADFPVSFEVSIWNDIITKIRKVQYYTNSELPVPWEESSAVLNPSECQQCGLKRACNPQLMRRVS